MSSTAAQTLTLSDLALGLPGLTPRWGALLEEASVYCFECQNHKSGTRLQVEGSYSTEFGVDWTIRPTEQTLLSWDDPTEAVEFGAEGVAILLMLDLTEYTVIRRARKGTGIDYWLGKKDSSLPFQDAARLEISGILKGGNAEIRARVGKKEKQTTKSGGRLPAYVAVVEFGKPTTHVVQK